MCFRQMHLHAARFSQRLNRFTAELMRFLQWCAAQLSLPVDPAKVASER